MSVATEFAPVVYIPERARTQRPLATVLTLRPPLADASACPLTLTRRGVLALSAAVAALAIALVWLAALSAPAASSAPAGAPASVTVRNGDTLWSIATRVAPDRDPRAEVATLQQLNHLSGVALQTGQVIKTRR